MALLYFSNVTTVLSQDVSKLKKERDSRGVSVSTDK